MGIKGIKEKVKYSSGVLKLLVSESRAVLSESESHRPRYTAGDVTPPTALGRRLLSDFWGRNPGTPITQLPTKSTESGCGDGPRPRRRGNPEPACVRAGGALPAMGAGGRGERGGAGPHAARGSPCWRRAATSGTAALDLVPDDALVVGLLPVPAERPCSHPRILSLTHNLP